MTDDAALSVLLATAVSIAALHTIVGVDHSLPFIVLGRARGWSLTKVLGLTALCGVGHVLSSILLGAVGLGVGAAVEKLEWIEGTRGGVAAWLMIGFGLSYAVWAFWRAGRGHGHSHRHVHHDGIVHSHPHDHQSAEHRHPHEALHETRRTNVVMWTLFVIFVLGPCEPLIPLLMAPAAMHHMGWAVLIAFVFGVVTIGAMLAVVTIGYLGLSKLRVAALTRHADSLAGLAIAASGVAIQALGI